MQGQHHRVDVGTVTIVGTATIVGTVTVVLVAVVAEQTDPAQLGHPGLLRGPVTGKLLLGRTREQVQFGP